MATPSSGDPVLASDIKIPKFKRKSGTETRTSTIAVSADADFVFALGVGTFEVRAYLTATGAAAGDVRVNWAFTGTATISRTCTGPGPTITTSLIAENMVAAGLASTSSAVYGTDGTNASGILEELLLEITVAGTLTMQWAQGTSSVTASNLTGSSRCIITELEDF